MDLAQERQELSAGSGEGQRELRRVQAGGAQALLEFKELLIDKEKTPTMHELKKKDKK
jgi:hypothetical protein